MHFSIRYATIDLSAQINELQGGAFATLIYMGWYLSITMTTYTQWLAAHEQIIVRLENGEISNEEAGNQIRTLPYISIFKRFNPRKRYGIYEVLHEALEDVYDKQSNNLWYELVHNSLIKAKYQLKITKMRPDATKKQRAEKLNYYFSEFLYYGVFELVKTLGGVHAFYKYVRVIEQKIDGAYIALNSELRYHNMREDIS